MLGCKSLTSVPLANISIFWSMLQKSLKIPKRQSEYVYRRRTDNTMAKRKSTGVQKVEV